MDSHRNIRYVSTSWLKSESRVGPGSGTKSTQTFTVGNSWQMNWSYDCSNFGDQGNFQVFIYTSDGSMSFDNAPVNEEGMSGSDTEYYHAGGSYYIEVNSECNWKITVQD